jgi:CPA1 family monovalent cation:H+ antiporter
LTAAVPLVLLARKVNVAYPIVLVLFGLVLGFVPGLPQAKLPPDIILVIFLPPLLFWETITAPTRAFKAFAQPILRLAVGLVIVTTASVAWVAHALIPGLPWAAAFVFGAIVSPTDEVAFTPVAERFGIPLRVVAIVEGESLLNDATALVIYAVAIEAIVQNAFVWWHAGLLLVAAFVGSIAIGFVVGVVIVRAYALVREPMLVALFSLLGGYLAYIPAQHLGLSGVLATVTAAFYVSRRSSTALEPAARVLSRGAWSVLIFVLNTTIFILVGVQLGPLVRGVHDAPLGLVAAAIVGVNATILVVRFVWTMGIAWPIDRYIRSFEEHPPWRNYLLTAWCGMRGGVSLAAALAIPFTLANNAPFPHRSLLIVLTYSVILVTLVGQGATLPLVLRALRITGDTTEEREEREARREIAETSLRRLDDLVADGTVRRATADRVKRRLGDANDASSTARRDELYDAEERVLLFQHEALLAMRDRGVIENTVVRHLETTLDLKRLAIHEERAHHTRAAREAAVAAPEADAESTKDL